MNACKPLIIQRSLSSGCQSTFIPMQPIDRLFCIKEGGETHTEPRVVALVIEGNSIATREQIYQKTMELLTEYCHCLSCQGF